jgi:hypothetical protein
MGGGRWRLKIRANDSSRTERRWGLGVATSAPALSCRAPKPPRRRGGSTRCLRGPGGGPFTRIPMQAGCYYCTSALHVQGVWCCKKKNRSGHHFLRSKIEIDRTNSKRGWGRSRAHIKACEKKGSRKAAHIKQKY